MITNHEIKKNHEITSLINLQLQKIKSVVTWRQSGDDDGSDLSKMLEPAKHER